MTEYVNSEPDEKVPALTPEEIKVRLVNEAEQHMVSVAHILEILAGADLGVEATRHNARAQEYSLIASEALIPLRNVLVREQNANKLGVVRHGG